MVRIGSARGNMPAAALIAGAVGLLALPSAVLAFTVRFEPESQSIGAGKSAGIVSSEDAPDDLARPFPIRSLARAPLYPFTPASTPDRPDRSVTVAVRVDPATARAISAQPGSRLVAAADGTELRIAPTAFNLGVSRGYNSFAPGQATKERKGGPEFPDLTHFSIAPGKSADESRLNPRIVLDETQSAGRTPRSFAGDGDDMVDVGGSYRVAKNIDVTAGVRYSQERERLAPVTDGKQDSQAVYVGTQFRF